jgi:ribosomal protein L21
MHGRDHRLTITEAIDQAGPVLFGTDWIGQCDAKEIRLLAKYGPKPYGKPHQSIARCPDGYSVALNRAIGKDQRMLVQRATVFDWIRAARVLFDLNHCDAAALDKKLMQARRQKNPVGAPAVARQRVIRQMLDNLRSGKVSATSLKEMKQEIMEQDYGASRKVCKVARIDALAEAQRQGLF